MKTLLFTTLLVGLSMATYAETADEAAVRAAHEAYVTAAKAGDGATLGKLFADGLQYSHSNTLLESKEQAIAALVKSKSFFEVHSQTIHVYGKAATIRAKVTAHGPTGDTPLTILQVWVKNGKQWQMTERQTTRIPAPTK
ncbi:MAG TPA: nuclear transport factor 2 family protein [Bryobacteraceae bacterium]|nr:nuclear transport factor 2 family protein [Bryobacteraceae bacterium]